jgi:hypothetical protein
MITKFPSERFRPQHHETDLPWEDARRSGSGKQRRFDRAFHQQFMKEHLQDRATGSAFSSSPIQTSCRLDQKVRKTTFLRGRVHV